jgi:hypothetical protein
MQEIIEKIDKPAHYLPSGDLDNLLVTIENQRQTINFLINALNDASNGLLDCAENTENGSDLLDIARQITKTLATVAQS